MSFPPLLALDAVLAKSVQTSHKYPMLVSWTIQEGTWRMGLGGMLDHQPQESHVDGSAYMGIY